MKKREGQRERERCSKMTILANNFLFVFLSRLIIDLDTKMNKQQ